MERKLSRRANWAGGAPIANVLMAKTLAQPELISLAAGFVDQETLPTEPSGKAIEAIWSDPVQARSALQYGTTIGNPPLREEILQRMVAADGCSAAELNLDPSHVVITAGSNQLLHLVGDCLLDPGDIILCGAPSYFVFMGTIANLGGRAVGVAIDEQGVIPEAVEAELERIDAAGELDLVKAIYVTTHFDNPSGVTVPEERRARFVEIAKRWSRKTKIRVIEDTAYRELRYYGDDVRSMRSLDPDGDTVIVAGSFSKSFSPGLRVGWGILPPDLIGPVLSLKGNFDFGSPNMNQMIMSKVLALGLFDPHVEKLRESYRRKLDAALEAADTFLTPIDGISWVRPQGGLYVWLALPDGIDAGIKGPLFDTAVDEGVLYVPGEYCYPAEGVTRLKNRIRLSFGIQSCGSIRRGVEALARAIRQVMA